MKWNRAWMSPAVACVVSSASVLAAQDVPRSEDLGALDVLVRSFVGSEAVSTQSPGCVVGILRRGEPPAVHAFGMAELHSKRAIGADTAFYIASTAKQFTAACVAHAADAGRLSLDDSITKHVNGLPDAYQPVTLRHLMNQRSGVKDVYEVAIALDLGRDVLASNAAALGVVRRLDALDFAPGERCSYSNSGYVLLAEALRSATGSALAKYARDHIFKSLGMECSYFAGESPAKTCDVARSYRPRGDSFEPIELTTGLVGPGGMWTSFADLARWDRAWIEGRFASSKVREALVTPPRLAGSQSLHPVFGPYAGGLMVGTWRGLDVVRHAGGAFGYSAEIMRFPAQGISVIALSNHAGLDARRLAEGAAALALREHATTDDAVEPAAGASLDLSRFGRIWRDESSGIVWALTLHPDRKSAATLGDVKFDVTVASPNRLESVRAQAPVTFEFEPTDGAFERMRVRSAGVLVADCRPMTFPPRDLPPSSEYEGRYRFAALDASVEFRADGAKLTLVQKRPISPAAPFVLPPFHPLGEDLFVCDAGAQLRFTRDAEGRVDGAVLDVSRVRGLRLARQ